MLKKICLSLLFTCAGLFQLQAQFSSGVDYVEQQKKIDENRRFGFFAGMSSSSFDWIIDRLPNVSSEFNGDYINCELSNTITRFTVGGYYFEKTPDLTLDLSAEVSNLNRDANLKVKDDSLNHGFTLSNYELMKYGFAGAVQFKDQPYFVSGSAAALTSKQNSKESSSFAIYLEPGIQIFKNRSERLTFSAGAAYLDDNYAQFCRSNLYLAEVHDQYTATIKYEWQKSVHSFNALYKFAMQPEDLYSSGGDYSNIEAAYSYSLKQYDLGIVLTAGLNLQHSINHIAEPLIAIPFFYYKLHLDGEYLNNRLLLGLDWQLKSVHTWITDDQPAFNETLQKLQVAPEAIRKAGTTNDQYIVKFSCGYLL